jgi:hypothetical protein
MEQALRALILHPEDAEIIHGAARGADTLAARWARRHGVPQIACPADWKTHPRAAGVLRNTSMLMEHKPHVVIAFPGGNGTADMVRKARLEGVIVIEVTGPAADWRGKP